MDNSDLLDQRVIRQQGAITRIRRWWRGIHPEKGIITRGLTGWETVEEMDLLPIHAFRVADAASHATFTPNPGSAGS